MSKGIDAIEQELQGERAVALGEAGKRVERALEALVATNAEEDLEEAATAVWYYLIVRESLHMFDHREALAIYGVPPRVMARVGVVKRT